MDTAATEKQVVKLLADEIIRAIQKITEENNRQYVNNQIANYKMTSANVSSDLHARFADIAVIEAESAVIHTAQIEDLYATVAEFIHLAADNAELGDVTAESIVAGIAQVTQAEIGTADIGWAQIKDLVTDTAIIEEGIGGKLYIKRLAVTEANMVSLTVGELVVKGSDGNFYALTVDENGEVQTELKEVTGDNIADSTVSGGNLIEKTITARELNVEMIFADEALIGAIKAANIDVADLFANNAFIAQLTTSIIQSPSIGNELDISGNASITLTNERLALVVSGESTETELVLTDKALSAIAENVNLQGNESVNLIVDSATEPLESRISVTEEGIQQSAAELDDLGARVTSAESKLTPDAMETTIANSEAVSNVKQQADRIDIIITGDSTETSVQFTPNALNAIAEDINLEANNQFTVTAGKIDLIVEDGSTQTNLQLTDEALNAIANDVNLSANNSVNIMVGNAQLSADSAQQAADEAMQSAQDAHDELENVSDQFDQVGTLIQQLQDQIELRVVKEELETYLRLTQEGVDIGRSDSAYITTIVPYGVLIKYYDEVIAEFSKRQLTAPGVSISSPGYTGLRIVLRAAPNGSLMFVSEQGDLTQT